jgi:hypothetical protein
MVEMATRELRHADPAVVFPPGISGDQHVGDPVPCRGMVNRFARQHERALVGRHSPRCASQQIAAGIIEELDPNDLCSHAAIVGLEATQNRRCK